MNRTIEVETTYKCTADKAIEKFFKKNPDLIYWEDEFVYMLENNIEFESDNVLGSGGKESKLEICITPRPKRRHNIYLYH